MDENECVVPQNLAKDKFLIIGVDNIDISPDTLDGKKSFHGAEMAVFQKQTKQVDERYLEMGQEKTLTIPPQLQMLAEAPVFENRPVPSVKYDSSILDVKDPEHKQKCETKILAWLLRNHGMAPEMTTTA